MKVLDLFSAAAGGWSLGMHRAGFTTVAACEVVDWRRALYAENNPGVRIYDDVRTLTAARLLADIGNLPDVVVGSPPCQDISSANTKGKGVDGERSGLFFEAVRIIGEIRPRWFALENSPRLRTKGADRVLGELEALGYACWPLVVGADDVGANHRRKRVWIVGRATDADVDASRVGCGGGGARRHGPGGDRAASTACGAVGDADEAGLALGKSVGDDDEPQRPTAERTAHGRDGAHAYGEGQPDGAEHGEMGGCAGVGGDAGEPWPHWNGGVAGHLRVDDGLSAWVAGARVEVGGGRGKAASGLLVEAFGDAVLPQITEAIGRAILRTEAALAAIYAEAA